MLHLHSINIISSQRRRSEIKSRGGGLCEYKIGHSIFIDPQRPNIFYQPLPTPTLEALLLVKPLPTIDK